MGFSTVAFTAKILSWRFRHLNIVGCLLKTRPTKGGGGHGHPRTPLSYAPVAISGERAIRTVKLEYWSFHLFFFGDEHILKIK